MTNTLLDFSQRPELTLHARVVADVEAVARPLGIVPLVAGAFARDLHLHYGSGIHIQRKTEDGRHRFCAGRARLGRFRRAA